MLFTEAAAWSPSADAGNGETVTTTLPCVLPARTTSTVAIARMGPSGVKVALSAVPVNTVVLAAAASACAYSRYGMPGGAQIAARVRLGGLPCRIAMMAVYPVIKPPVSRTCWNIAFNARSHDGDLSPFWRGAGSLGSPVRGEGRRRMVGVATGAPRGARRVSCRLTLPFRSLAPVLFCTATGGGASIQWLNFGA